MYLNSAVEPRINTDAAKRFVRNALWEAEEQQQPGGEEQVMAGHGGEGSSRKREMDSELNNPESSKRTRL